MDSLKEDALLEANTKTEVFNLNYLSLLLNLKLWISYKSVRLVVFSHWKTLKRIRWLDKFSTMSTNHQHSCPSCKQHKRSWAEASSADALDLTFCLPNRVTSKFQKDMGNLNVQEEIKHNTKIGVSVLLLMTIRIFSVWIAVGQTSSKSLKF